MNRLPIAAALAVMIASAAPARADNPFTGLFNGFRRNQANNAAASEKCYLDAVRVQLRARNNVSAALGEPTASLYISRRDQLIERMDATIAAVDAGLRNADGDAAYAAVNAARDRGNSVRHDAQTWLVLPLEVERIDAATLARTPVPEARYRPALIAAMRAIAESGDYAGARRGVQAAMNR